MGGGWGRPYPELWGTAGFWQLRNGVMVPHPMAYHCTECQKVLQVSTLEIELDLSQIGGEGGREGTH